MSESSSPYNGKLELRGIVDVNQFYYHGGNSDADTMKVGTNIGLTKFTASNNSEVTDVLPILKMVMLKRLIQEKGKEMTGDM